jgi:hypothetical protein
MYLGSRRILWKPMPRLIVVFALTLLVAACAEPPAKEMHQAQGAIDAARAAGAEEYAADELKLAVDGLSKYQDAVAARDYRLALAHALDSRERAQNAAKTAVDARARARGDAERELAEAVALVQRADARLRDAAVAKLPRRTLAPIEQAIAATSTSLQDARAALGQEDYGRVGKLTATVTEQIQATLAEIDSALKPPVKGRRR